jgi:hypothetical protein
MAQSLSSKMIKLDHWRGALPHHGLIRPNRLMAILIGWGVLGVCYGCSGKSGILTGGTTVGQLKTSLSHLEFENDQLKRQVAKLEQEDRRLEDRLVQEQIDNGDLAARLDDARNALRDRGLEPETVLGSHPGTGKRDGATVDGGDDTRRRTLPAAQSSKKRRKPPFAQIPRISDDDSPTSHEDNQADSGSAARDRRTDRRVVHSSDNLDRQSVHRNARGWLPVADSSDDTLSRLR